MKEGWTYKSFTECVNKIPKQKQVKSKDYKTFGLYPIVSQEKELISGYWDDESFVYKHTKPIIIFGDHTKEIKYIDFDFVVGADGTQILSPKDDIDSKFFYYALLATPLKTLGYARHFKLLKKKSFNIPPLPEQQAIVSRLDAAFMKIDALKTNAERQLAEARALFQKALTDAMTPKDGWEKKRLKKLAAKLFAGGDVPKESFSKTQTPQYCIPIVSNGIENNGLYGYTEFARVNEPAVTISGRGTIGYIVERKSPFFPIIRLITIIPHLEIIGTRFLYYALRNIDFSHSGSSIPQLTVPMVKDLEIPLPPLSEQQAIVSRLDALSENACRYEEIQRKTITECDALKQALLRDL